MAACVRLAIRSPTVEDGRRQNRTGEGRLIRIRTLTAAALGAVLLVTVLLVTIAGNAQQPAAPASERLSHAKASPASIPEPVRASEEGSGTAAAGDARSPSKFPSGVS